MRGRFPVAFSAVLAASFAAPQVPTRPKQPWKFVEDFGSYPQGPCLPDLATFGPWTVRFGGLGCVQVEGTSPWLHEAPLAATQPSETHASLVTGPALHEPFTLRASVATITQLRVGSPPNPWEVAWLVWDYVDDAHFYYFALKTNGWELGKRDPAYPGGQRFLATGSSPSVVLGTWAEFVVRQHGATLELAVDQGGGPQSVVTFTDLATPYLAGAIGFYNEDAHVHFDDVRLTVP